MTGVVRPEMATEMFSEACWDRIRLVVFDVDGTLYRQLPVRAAMGRALITRALLSCSLKDLHAIRAFRAAREAAADRALDDFERVVLAEAAEACGYSVEALETLVRDWIETRPLSLLAGARVRGVADVFDALRASGRRIAVWSDHPVREKLTAMQLEADDMVAATDPELRKLKPNPAGLELLMRRAGATASETLMIGDRPDRDGAAAVRAGVAALLRCSRQVPEFRTFRNYLDPIFAPVHRLRSAA
jgi:FMN phosphatase YigB (HAD superfamily)